MLYLSIFLDADADAENCSLTNSLTSEINIEKANRTSIATFTVNGFNQNTIYHCSIV